jgi:hypothetical protein
MPIEIQFRCSRAKEDYLTVKHCNTDKVWIEGEYEGKAITFVLDITTAIKFSKTIRTEINKAKEIDFDAKSNLF